MLPQIHFIFITQSLVLVVFCQHIQLFPYNQTKNCNISLVKENDRILMYGKVDFNGNIPASSVVNFEIKGKTETSFQLFYFLKVPKECDKVFNNCNCFKTDDPKVFKLSLNITAFTVNSEADVRTELVYRETTFHSEIRHLPIVYGSKTDLVVVYANGQVIHFQQTDVSINDTQVTIVSVCRENVAHNCKQQLLDLETGTLVESGKEIIVYNTNIKGRSNFKLKYSVCNIERNISFSITTDKTNDNLHLTTEDNPEVTISLSAFIVTLVIVVGLVVFVSSVFASKKIRTQISSKMSCKRKTLTDRKVSKRLITEYKSTDLCFPQDTCGLNVCLKDQTDLAAFSSLGYENQDTDSYHFTSDQSKVQSDEFEGPLIGDHETQESEGGEADLHKHRGDCKKNPGHRQFIPVDTFTLKHLPEDLQDKDLYEYIKVIADLTVRVCLEMSSPDRPEFYPKTNRPYPFSNMSERRNLRTGSGKVWYVNK
ncbi:hypothetical protein BgiMline_031840 [Biomphalaria glabrata]